MAKNVLNENSIEAHIKTYSVVFWWIFLRKIQKIKTFIIANDEKPENPMNTKPAREKTPTSPSKNLSDLHIIFAKVKIAPIIDNKRVLTKQIPKIDKFGQAPV